MTVSVSISSKSPDYPTHPREKIRRITSSYPNNIDSPFYDPFGTPMKPVARLTVTKQRLYGKTHCTDPRGRYGWRDAGWTTHVRTVPLALRHRKGYLPTHSWWRKDTKRQMDLCQQYSWRHVLCEETCDCNGFFQPLMNSKACETRLTL